MGTPIGVVVVPAGFAPGGKARIVSLYGVDINGNKTLRDTFMGWGLNNNDTNLTNYRDVLTTDNAGSTSTGSNQWGYLPSDNFNGSQSFIDSKAYYFIDNYTPFTPSLYLEDEPNPEYYSGNKALCDFNGLSNTQTLVSLGSEYEAANACWNYKDDYSNLQWYLPAAGELGYLIIRYNKINNSLNKLNSILISEFAFWSSTETNDYYAYRLDTATGYIDCFNKSNNYNVRPFATI